jgi:mRNA-degrading endonuclease toxin of MazEF toxin-antitoxin module
MTFERGGVHIAVLPGLGRRPALIVSADPVNLRLRQPVVARITATDRPRVLGTYVRLDAFEAGLERESFVLCHDLSTVPAEGFGARLALLTAKRMEEVDAALERALDLV